MRLAAFFLLIASTAWAQFGVPNNPVGGGPGVLTHVGACGDQQQCYTFCPAGSVMAAPGGSPGAVDCIPLTTAYLPAESLYTFDTPDTGQIASFVSENSRETTPCPTQCNALGALIGPSSTSVPGRIWLYETSGAGNNFWRIQVPVSGLSADKVIEVNADGTLPIEDSKLDPAPSVNKVACFGPDGKLFAGTDETACPATVSTTTSTTFTTSTTAAPTTSTSTSTSTSVATTSSTSTTVAGCADSATMLNLGAIDRGHDVTSSHTDGTGDNVFCNSRQRIENSSALTICSITICLGNDATPGTGRMHLTVYSEKTVGCSVGAPWCPDALLGTEPTGDSDGTSDGEFDVSTLTATNDIVLGAPGTGGTCGTDDNGKLVTFTWASDKPNPTGNFWIVANGDEGSTLSESVYWGSTLGATNYSTTDFDTWAGCAELDRDHYFVVGVE